MTLAIHTPAGLRTVKQEDRLVELLRERAPDVEYMRTSRSGDRAKAAVDAVLVRAGEVIGVAESKCRNITREEMRKSFDNEWLITAKKMFDCRAAGVLLQVPTFGLLYCVKDDSLVIVKLFDEDGESCRPMRFERTLTQATVNGGQAFRTNGYVEIGE